MKRTLVLLSLALSLAGCISDKADHGKLADASKTPTEQYPLKAEQQPDQVLLAVHDGVLSQAQEEAVRALAGRWREAGGQTISVSAPHGKIDSYAVFRAQQAIRERLIAYGVPEGQIIERGYEAGDDPKPPLMIEFTRFVADVPQCGRVWEDYSRSGDNQVTSNFGCAVSANMAAQIANAADIAGPKAADSPDVNRRVQVVDNYRKGELTAAKTDDAKSSGAIATVVP